MPDSTMFLLGVLVGQWLTVFALVKLLRRKKI
jgi:hypothetical protein